MENISEQTLAIMSVYDPDGIVDDYIVYYLNSLKEVADRIIIVVNGMITDTGKVKLKRMTKDVFVRQNTGFDFGGHKTVLEEYLRPGEIDQYQQLILCNDTCFGPFVPFKTIFKTMHRRGLEFWSINYRDNILLPYYESYFIVLSGRALKLAVDFLHNDVDSGTGQINQARGYEHGLSELMMQQNVLAGCYTSGQEVYPNLDIYRSPDYAMKYLGLPLMKKKCFSSDIFERENCCEALRTIMEKTTYPVEYIIETISRVYGIQFQKKDLLVPNKTSAYAFWKFYVSRQDMIEFCEKNPKVYLYGKGYMAMFIYIRFRRYMNDFGGYIISDELYTDEMREDKMVYPLSRIHRDAPIIVALSEKNTGEVSGKLREWKNVIFLSMPQNGNREEG